MATSGTIEKKFHGGSTGGYYFGIDWKVNSQSTSNNSSNVTASVFIRTSGTGYTISSTASKNITLTINGTSYSGTATVGMSANSKKTLLTKTVNVKHNSDGTKTCAFACSGALGLTLSGTKYNTVSHSGNGTFNTINLNTAPWWTSDDARMNNIKNNVIIPENWGSVTITSATATDTQSGGNIHYDIHRYVNGNYSAQIKHGGNSLTANDNLSSWGQGTAFKYECKVHDGSLWASGSRWSWTYTKNTFTRASVTSIGSIGINSTGISFTSTGIKNSGGGNGYVNTSFGYRIESLTSGVNIYGTNTVTKDNQDNVAFTLGVKNNGGSPTNSHWLDANELRAAFRNSNYVGTLKLRLVSWNSYGSQGYYDFNVAVDLRKPAPSTTVNYASNNKITHGGIDYYIPAHLPFTISWNAVNDSVEGNACTYDVYYQIGTEALKFLGSTTGTSYTTYLGSTAIGNNKTSNFKIVVRVKTRYGYTADCSGASITLWDYAPPTIRTSTIDRTATDVTINGTITINSSIPSISLSSTQWKWSGGSNTTFTVTNSSTANIKNFTITTTAAQNLSGTIQITSSDSVRDLLSKIVTTVSATTSNIAIKAYMPIMSITRNGLGIKTRPNGYELDVEGSARVTNITDSTIIGGTGKPGTTRVTDLNKLWKSGFYEINTGSNKPDTSDWHWVIHSGHTSNNSEGAYNYGLQIAGSNSKSDFYMRNVNASGDGTWRKLLYSNIDSFTMSPTSSTFTNYTKGSIFGSDATARSGIAFQAASGSNDPGSIYHETSSASDSVNRSVLHLCPSDDNDNTNDYVTIHGYNKSEAIRMYTGGNIWTSGTLTAGYGRFASNPTSRILTVEQTGTTSNYCPMVIQTPGNTNWGNSLEIRTNNAGNDRPTILFSSANTSVNYTIGMGGNGSNASSDAFTINTQHGVYNSGWGTNIIEIRNSWGVGLKAGWFRTWGSNGWYNETHGGGWYMTDSNFLRAYNDKSIYTGGSIQSKTSRARYVKALNSSNNLDFEFDSGIGYFNVYSSSGAGITIGRPWSGSSGTEPCLYNNKGNGWGFLGNSGYTFYRVYGAGGSVSLRERKYEISKADTELQYENLKSMNIYNYRTISTADDTTVEELAKKHLTHALFENEDGTLTTESIEVNGIIYNELDSDLSQDEIRALRIKEIVEKNPNFGNVNREDLMLGAMVDELPTEITFYDNEGGDGKAVDMYSYTTMIAAAVKHLIYKVEQLEMENEKLKNTIENQEV